MCVLWWSHKVWYAASLYSPSTSKVFIHRYTWDTRYNLSLPTIQFHDCIRFPSNYFVRRSMNWYNLFHFKDFNSSFFVWICNLIIHQLPHRNVMSVCFPRTSKHCYRVFHSVTYMNRNTEQFDLKATMYRSIPHPTLSLPLSVTWPVERFKFYESRRGSDDCIRKTFFIGTSDKLNARHNFQYLIINYINFNVIFDSI